MTKVSPLSLFGIGFAALALSLLVGFLSQSDVPPIQGAKPILSLKGGSADYWWINGQELLLLRERKPARFVRYSLTEKSETALPELSERFTQSGGLPETLRISGDGLCLLWSAQDKKRTLVSRIDGSAYQETKHSLPTLSVWRTSSQSWIGFGIRDGRFSTGEVFYRDETTPKIKIPPLASTYFLEPTDTIGNSFPGTNISRAIITEAGQFLAQLWAGPDTPTKTVQLGAAGFSASPMESRYLRFVVPHQNDGAEVFFSPDETVMGWIVKFRSPLAQNLDFGKPPFKKYYTGLWITNRQTKTTTVIGSLATVRDDPASGPYSVKFTPDTDAISYIYQNTLYVLTVPK